MEPISRKPIVIVADDHVANRCFVANVLSAAGWRVIEAVDGDDAVAAVREALPDLVIMDIDMPRMDGAAAARAIRREAPPAGSVPILAYTAMRVDDAWAQATGMDGRIPKPCPPEALVAAAGRWRPDGELFEVRRLMAVFGVDEMARLVAHFREQLAEAVDDLDAGGGMRTAHRIAGAAGTLGFGAVSASWLKLSEGDATLVAEARRDARIAIARIDHYRHAADPS